METDDLEHIIEGCDVGRTCTSTGDMLPKEVEE